MGDQTETMALFGHRGEVATDATKGRRASVATKGPGDFLLNFDHAEILFGAIVGKWHAEIGHEYQDGWGVALETVQQVLGFGLFDSPSLLEHRKRGRLGSQASEDELLVGCSEMLNDLLGQTACSSRTSLFYSGMAHKQMLFQFACPLLLLLFMEKAQIAKMMSIAQCMGTLGVLGVATVAIMDHRPLKLRQDADLIGGGLASLTVASVMGQGLGPCRMQPMQDALHPDPRLIGSHHFCGLQGLLDLLFHLDEPICSFCDEGFERPGPEATATHVGEQFSGSCIRQKLSIAQIEGGPFEHRSILHRCTQLAGKVAAGDRLAVWAAHIVGLIFGDLSFDLRQINQLTTLQTRSSYPLQAGLTVRTRLWTHNNDLIGCFHEMQCASAMTFLPSCFLATLLSQTPRLLPISIR